MSQGPCPAGGCEELSLGFGLLEEGAGLLELGVPVQATPLRVKLVGTGLVPVHAPLKPKDVEAPVATDPL